MRVILNDGSEFMIDEDSSSVEIIDRIIRIMKYMTYSDVTIAKGLAENLLEMTSNSEVEKMVSEICEECGECDDSYKVYVCGDACI